MRITNETTKEAGIPEPGFVVQDSGGGVIAFVEDPYIPRADLWWYVDAGRFAFIKHPPFTSDWHDKLVFVKHPTLADVTAAHTIDEYDQ